MDCFAKSVSIVSAYIVEGQEFLMNLPGGAAAGLRKAFRAMIASTSMGRATFRRKTSFRQMLFFVYATKYSLMTRPPGPWFQAIPLHQGLPLLQQIGSASCRESVCQSVWMSVSAGSSK